MIKEGVPDKCDALVIGGGAAGLISALTVKASRPEWSVCLLEQSGSIGGASAYSGGVIWLPGHRFRDDPSGDTELARRYLKNAYPEIDEVCLDGFLEDAPRVLEFMIAKGCKMDAVPRYPDYYMDIEGSSSGRSISVLVYTGSKRSRSLIRKLPMWYLPFTIRELTDWGPHRILHWRQFLIAKRMLRRQLTMGRALIGYLLDACLNEGVDIVLGCKTERLLLRETAVLGAVVDGNQLTSPNVIMACGGFSHNPELMRRLNTARQLLSVAPEECDDGGALSLALDAGVEIGNPHCWWMPVIKLYGEDEEKPGPDLWSLFPTVYDRARAGGIMVNSQGRRFANEAANYNTLGGIMAVDEDSSLDQVWMICGEYYIKHYPLGIGSTFRSSKRYLNESRSIEELASRIEVPADNLKETIDHWNDMAAREKDEDFHRGESAYDRFTGDRFREGHPSIEKIEPPFQALRIHAGCLGTKMGPMTDSFGRVRLENGDTVSGLYAVGTAQASPFGNAYPGAGGSLAQCVVFGFRAGLHAAGVS